MIKIEIIEHRECSDTLIRQICEFKNLNWQYPIESHLSWIKKNLKSEDLHLLLYDDDRMCAYLNFVDTSIIEDKDIVHIWGIGNVCVSPECKGMGYGNLIMDLAKSYCKKSKRIGMLFCQDKNVGFYNNCGWFSFKGSIENVDHGNLNINTFATKAISAKTITVLRDF